MIKVYHSAQRGQTQVVLLEGEVGIGKTRLATEFLAWAEMEGADVLQGQAFETGGHLPYRPVIEALRPRIERENAPDDLLSDIWLAELSRLLPELCDRYPDLPDPVGDKSVARNRLFEAVARLGQALAARTLLVLFIDDVQWADAASLDVLHYLARRLRGERDSCAPAPDAAHGRESYAARACRVANWYGTRRTADPPAAWPSHQPKTSCACSMHSGGKGAKTGGESADLERFGQWLFAETEGQPFYLMETLKVLLERGVLASRPNEDGGWTIDFTAAMEHEMVVRGFFPPSVREVICARLDRLHAERLSRCWWQEPSSTRESPLSTCARWPISQNRTDSLPWTRCCTAACCMSRSAREGHMTDGRYVFAHAKIRAVVYAEAGEARRSIFHRRALEALQAAGCTCGGTGLPCPGCGTCGSQPSAGVSRQAMRRCGW